MKKRIKTLIAIFLAFVVMLGMTQPIKASASEYERRTITYMAPGEILSLQSSSYSGYGVRIHYCKPGTDPTSITKADVIKTVHFFHEDYVDEDFAEEQILADFKDLGIEGDYKQWLFVQMGWGEPDSYFNGDQYCLIPVKGNEDDFCYLVDGVYSEESQSVTFTVSDNEARKLNKGNNNGGKTSFMWSTYQKKDAQSQIYISSEKADSDDISFDTDESKDEYTITLGENFKLQIVNVGRYEHCEVFKINEKAISDSLASEDIYSSINYLVEYDLDLKYNDAKDDGGRYICCEMALTDRDSCVNDWFIDACGEALKGHYYRMITGNQFEQDGNLYLTIRANSTDTISGTVKIKLYPTEITVRQLRASDSVIIKDNSITVKGDYDPDIQFLCQMSNSDWTNNHYRYTVISNFAKMVKPFNITANSSAGGTITADKKAIPGDEVSVTLAPKSGYSASGITVKTDSGKKVATTKKSNTSYTFIMPDENVEIDANFKAVSNSVSIASVKNVTVKSDKTKAKVGETVTITACPKNGYKVTGLTVTDSGKKTVKVTKGKDATKYTFKMPSSPVTVKATVKEAPYVTVVNKKLQMSVGQKFSKLGVKVASYDKVTAYKSSKTSVATVDKTGKIAAKAKGSTVITVTSKKGASAKITVTVGTKKITTSKITLTNVTKGKLSLKKNEKFTVKYELNPITSQDKVTFKSSNAKVATIDSKGKITPKKAGKTTITVTSGKKKVSFALTVK